MSGTQQELQRPGDVLSVSDPERLTTEQGNPRVVGRGSRFEQRRLLSRCARRTERLLHARRSPQGLAKELRVVERSPALVEAAEVPPALVPPRLVGPVPVEHLGAQEVHDLGDAPGRA